jgi:hypothetical protein
MASKRLPMRKMREVLRLSHACGLGECEKTNPLSLLGYLGRS